MSLLGRLEDLSLTDIIQIVFLSRRTGILEIIDHRGRFTVLFRHGLIVSASAPESPTLVGWLEAEGHIPPGAAKMIRQTEEAGVPAGTSVIDLNLVAKDILIELIQQRIAAIITPLLSSKEGEFNFILSDAIGALDIEYDPDDLFREGGITPQKLLQTEGEKLKPLRGLEESMRAGKELLRSASGAVPSALPPPLDLGLRAVDVSAAEQADADEPEAPFSEPEAAAAPADEEPFGTAFAPIEEPGALESLLGAEQPAAIPAPPPAPASPPVEAPAAAAPRRAASAATEFRIGSEADREAGERNVLVFERDPLVRVAVKRAFARKGVQIHQFGAIDDARRTAYGLLRENRFFVAFLEIGADGDASEAVHLLNAIKKKNHRLPVVVLDQEADLRRRHDLLKEGADLYLTKPSGAHLQPGIAEQQLTLFADELVVFTDRAFDEWEQAVSSYAPDEAGRKFYEAAEQEKVSRSFTVLRNLINELANPDDIRQVTETILRMSAEYVDRGVLFVNMPREFVGLGGFGESDMNRRARTIRIAKGTSSILDDVELRKQPHHGKIARTPGNERLMELVGPPLPTDLIVLPLVHEERVIGFLYADNAENKATIDNYSGLEIFLSQAGLAFDSALVAAARRHTMEQEIR